MSTKYKFIDLFAGCGGMSLGLEQAGFEPVLYNELNQSAAETYRINREDENIKYIRDVKDINKEKVEDLRNIDLVCGGPPCQGYSAIGIRRSHKAEGQDYRDETLQFKAESPSAKRHRAQSMSHNRRNAVDRPDFPENGESW